MKILRRWFKKADPNYVKDLNHFFALQKKLLALEKKYFLKLLTSKMKSTMFEDITANTIQEIKSEATRLARVAGHISK